MHARATAAVVLSALVLLAGVAPVGGAPAADLERPFSDERPGRVQADRPTAVDDSPVQRPLQYKVSLDNVTIKTWLLRNSTVLNVTVRKVVVRNATTPNGVQRNVTLRNVTIGEFELERARLKNVTARTLVVRNKSVLSVPGGQFIDPNVQNRTIDRHWTKNKTVSGVVIDTMVVEDAIRCGNMTIGPRANDSAAFDPTTSGDKPDITVKGGQVGEALVIKGHVSKWSVGSISGGTTANVSLPQGCNRG
ncbi:MULTISPECIES: hypothetical protein [Halorussus]|uniref:hypothetical protein n=1 Tax=Halorussus TaxID=1070314 RepID=UPI00209FA0B2|nr:hypothetical protein [Halorussus vallis]USZ76428.1 hypothetical protein NGM07_03655 [Halorussus vallis]